MGRKKENILTREPTRIYPSYQSGNQFGRFGTNSDTLFNFRGLRKWKKLARDLQRKKSLVTSELNG
jgi:hypothetical protein